MIYKPHACFGFVVLSNHYVKDEVHHVATSADSTLVMMLVKGHVVSKDKETGEFVEEFFPGAFGNTYVDGVFERITTEDSLVFCFDPRLNKGYVPPIDPVVMQPEDVETYVAGTRFFLCEGTIEVNGTEITGPHQVAFKGTQPMTAKTDVYGMLIR